MRKNILNFIIIYIFLFNLNCSNPIDKELHTSIKNKFREWVQTQDTIYLKQAYKLIKNSKEFKKQGLTIKNVIVFEPIFFNLKKYDELDSLLSNMKKKSKKLPKELEDNLLAVKYYKFKSHKDTVKLNNIINQMVNLQKKRIKENPKDSLLFFDYFIFKSKISSKEKLIKELDSIKEKGVISNIFYKYILQNIKNNPY